MWSNQCTSTGNQVHTLSRSAERRTSPPSPTQVLLLLLLLLTTYSTPLRNSQTFPSAQPRQRTRLLSVAGEDHITATGTVPHAPLLLPATRKLKSSSLQSSHALLPTTYIPLHEPSRSRTHTRTPDPTGPRRASLHRLHYTLVSFVRPQLILRGAASSAVAASPHGSSIGGGRRGVASVVMFGPSPASLVTPEAQAHKLSSYPSSPAESFPASCLCCSISQLTSVVG